MKKKIILFLLLIIFVFVGCSKISKKQIEQALEQSSSNNYGESIKIYEGLISEGYYNPTIYYNLANSYLKLNNIGKTSLNIERALKLSPRNKDIRLLKNYIAELTRQSQQNIAERFIEQITLSISLNEILIIEFVLFSIVCILLSLYFILYKKKYIKFITIFLFLFLFFLPILYLKIDSEILTKKAIIMHTIDVRNKPLISEEISFQILEGRRVVVMEELGKWVNIKLDVEGLSGWVDKHSLELI